MNTKSLLDQLLKSGSGLLGGTSSQQNQRRQPGSDGLAGLLSGRAGAALGGGALGLLLGSKKGRKLGGKVLTYGGMAALGLVAYKAYSNWQQNNQQQQTSVPATVDRVPEAEVEVHSKAILIAVIAAAKSDGHIDDREREIIDAEVAKFTRDASLLRWIDTELQKPLDPVAIASVATTQEIAAEMYLASVLVIDEESFMERSYLNELGKQLKLPADLQQEIKKQALAAEQLAGA
ncbi:tellurite resistance TerB family protein [Arsukibacterium indicum]|uniref:Tellurite resistance TerB family protein n=1 Tax=Arsukibacterium indicum TaxID=2848612 RepID=A0ABS6MM31_9GAMM|nr:tellurite resistance TerB family protein [Arsukibacterium indicum]MBV2129860.1 tellurite resistance TerB family protein [Arsukibacterium indicum]